MKQVGLFVGLLVTATSFSCGWTSNGSQKSPLSSTTSSVDDQLTTSSCAPFAYTAEVVGASGRIGSFWLCHSNHDGDDSNLPSSAAVVPRGLAPGCLTKVGCPIYVATPGDAWATIRETTLNERHEDLVFVGNGIPPDFMELATLIIPHFSILEKCTMDNPASTLQTSEISPKTYLYGKHARKAASVLQNFGVATKICREFDEVREAAIKKLMWASCMWLLCHEPTVVGGGAPLTVGQVHEEAQAALDRLVDDLFPAFEEIMGRKMDRQKIDKYLRDYSMSIESAIPSKQLGEAEFVKRNAVWLKTARGRNEQHFHKELLGKIVGEEKLKVLLSSEGRRTGSSSPKMKSIRLDSAGLTCSGRDRPSRRDTKRIVVVGGGMVGTSLALALKRRRPNIDVTILEKLPIGNVGETTPASWAWLNANGKSPKHYQILNQLGLHAWKHEPNLASLVSWSGSLVRFEKKPQFVLDGGYPAEGPLSLSRIHELEPQSNWKLDDSAESTECNGYTFFFKDEGCVDPSAAVRKLREAAVLHGVKVVDGVEVSSVRKDTETKQVCGVRAVDASNDDFDIDADLVVVAAGVGSSAKGLACGFELLPRPGAIAYIEPQENEQRRLSRILVDPLRSSHVLQRSDGTIVAGGGALEVGGTAGTVSSSSAKENRNPTLLQGAMDLSPGVMEGASLNKVVEAVRPMPTDGLPIVGFIDDGLYSIVTHSGITLGPLLSNMAAAEILEETQLDLLEPYRPTRFRTKETLASQP